jgi:hypothetical protein
MTLTTHAVAGALVGAVASHNLALAASAAFMSHFLFDTIPHWDYALGSTHEDQANPMNNDIKSSGKQFIIDLLKIACDAGLGILVTYIFFRNASNSVLIAALIGALFAMLPDPLQFVYWKFRHEPMISLQRFHMFMHAKMHLKDKPIVGILSQVVFIGIIYLLIIHIFSVI